MRPHALLALALLLAAAPSARAGTEEDPEVPGVADHDEPTLDFQGAWFESAREGVVFTLRIAGADEPPADRFYAVAFTHRGERYVAVVAFDEDGAMHTDVGVADLNERDVGPPESLADTLRDERFEPGEPAYVSALIPFVEVEGLAPGQVIIDLAAGTGVYDRGRRGGWNDVDGRETSNGYVIEQAFLPAPLQRNLAWIIAGALALLGAAVVGAVMVMRGRREPSRRTALDPPLAQPVLPGVAEAAPPQPRAPEPPPPPRAGAPKFRIDPRER